MTAGKCGRDQRGGRGAFAELRKRHGFSQVQVANRMDISVPRVSRIEKGDVSTRDVLDRYIAALGGTLNLVADFGDEKLKVG